ncbi:MAG: translation initiation factor IF-2 [Emergencia sp.]|nr:translation initiation factor IF-2 [Emergencia sp.]
MDKMETKPSRRDDSKRKADKGKNKFEKLERKSLEKQTRKKHNKPKPVAVEPEIEAEPLPEGTIVVNVPITVAGFCEQAEVSTSRVIMTLMKLGIMANINQNIDEDTVMILADELGISVAVGKVEDELEEEGLELFEDKEEDLKARPPIITVMGHVDHGKTSLLDAIRKTNVTSTESGGITQHIGASEVRINGQKIVFLDTPGHEAFTAMRARGAHVTDIAVLVVAADDSVKPQTIESISHAKAAGVPIIVAINKIDKPAANPDRVKQDLTEHGILVEDWGGDVISVPVSAKSGEGIVNLLEMILLQAEMMELRANPNRLAMGSVIEARLDKAKGPVATLLVTNGTLQAGQSVVAGTCSGRIRLMTDFKGKTIKKAGPATAVEILGLTDVPQAGDEFNAVKDDKVAREIAENRKEKLREEVLARNASTTLEKLFSQIQEGEVKELNLIIKGDVQGSVGALIASLEKLNNENVKVNVIHSGVGTVTESDVMLAGTAGAIIIGFNVRPSTAVQTMADRENIEIRSYRVIYDVIDDVENAMKGMLDPEFKEEILGKVEIRTTFKVPGVGIIGGAYVQEGKVVRNAEVRLVRDGIVIHEGKISSLKRFKDDAKEVASGYECGIGIESYNDIKEGDIIECFHMVEIERK